MQTMGLRCEGKQVERGREKAGVTGEFSLEFYNYFTPLDLQPIINYLWGLALAKSLGEERDRETEKTREREHQGEQHG